MKTCELREAVSEILDFMNVSEKDISKMEISELCKFFILFDEKILFGVNFVDFRDILFLKIDSLNDFIGHLKKVIVKTIVASFYQRELCNSEDIAPKELQELMDFFKFLKLRGVEIDIGEFKINSPVSMDDIAEKWI